MELRATRSRQRRRTFWNLAPGRWITMLTSADLSHRASGRCVFDATGANLTKQANGSAHGMLAGYRLYLAFCAIRKGPPFPVREGFASRRIAVLEETSAYANYISPLRK